MQSCVVQSVLNAERAELSRARAQLDTKCAEMHSMTSMMVRVKHLHAEQTRELEAQVLLSDIHLLLLFY